MSEKIIEIRVDSEVSSLDTERKSLIDEILQLRLLLQQKQKRLEHIEGIITYLELK